ncbi:MAG TPA: AAA family ATPase, partial [Myxococcota bacterium]|nr:AAA family ATPase [Myxococcota bacterium]
LEDLGPLTLEQLPEQPVGRVLHIAIQLATILGHVHAKGVLHRDLHPGNVAWDTDSERVTLLDFGAAARVERHSARGTAAGLGGAFGYWAPEQTGKWTNPIDRRTDLYALGGILYRVATGAAPGPEHDLLAAIHAALAVVPLPADQVRPSIPRPLARLISRLLCKIPDDRYQGANGLLADLLRMRDELRLTGRITDFELGTKDVPEILTLPRRLFGRDEALDQVQVALANEGNPELSPIIAISGPPGIGKSALVAEVARRVAAAGGSLVQGKFDQSSPSPLHGFTHPIGEAVRAVLSLPEAELHRVRESVRAAVQEAGPEFLDLVPRLRPLVPELTPVASLPPAEARNRTLAALEGLFRALRPAGRQVILFLDDLQWADATSLDLLERILLSPGVRPPILLGWRSTEVGPQHPLAQLLARVPPGRLLSVQLAPLNVPEISALLTRSLACKLEEVSRLAAILAAKSGGNPYFLLQLLETLDERELLRFAPEEQRWVWDNAEVEQLVVGDNVATLLAERLSALPVESRRVVSVTARCGYQVSLLLLSTALQQPAEELLRLLSPALVAGHVIENPDGQGVTFSHDRVIRAAIDLLPAEQWSREVGAIAARLAAGPAELDPFVVADRCQEALPTVHDSENVINFTRAFIRAAQVARLAGAVGAALDYAEQGAVALGRLPGGDEDPVRRRLFFDLYFEGARASAACPERTPTPDFIEVLLQRSGKQAARSRVHALKIQRHRGRWEHEAALDDTVVALAELGLRLPRHPTTVYALYRIAKTSLALWRRGDAALHQLPVATETEVQTAQEILLSSVSAAYLTSPNLLTLMISGSIDLALSRGTGAPTAWAFSTFAFIEAVIRGRLERGVHFARLARETLRRSGGGQFACRVELNIVGFVESLQGRLADIPDTFERICQQGITDGDWEYAVLSANNVLMFGIGTARSLEELADTADRLVATCADLGHRRHFADLRLHAQLVESLRSSDADAGALSGRHFRSDELEGLCRDFRDPSLKGSLYSSQTVVYAHLGDFEKAVEAADQMEPYLAGLPGAPAQYWHHLYAGIARAWMARSHASRPNLLAAAQKSLRELQRLAKISPHNHQHRVVILGAVLAAVHGD